MTRTMGNTVINGWYIYDGSRRHVNVVMTSGPDRIFYGEPKPETKVKPVLGFTKKADIEPLTWEGDGA